MSNIFASRKKFKNQSKRNTFDKSFQNNFTTSIGRLTPTLCKEVLPGESIKINAALGLRAMPLQFPIQTRLRVHNHFFYVPTRILCDKWEDGVFGIKDFEMPWIKTDDPKRFCTNSLADFLGVPSTIAGQYGQSFLPLDYFKVDAIQVDNYSTIYYYSNLVETVSSLTLTDFTTLFPDLDSFMSDSYYSRGPYDVAHSNARGLFYCIPKGTRLKQLFASCSGALFSQSVASASIFMVAYGSDSGDLIDSSSAGWTVGSPVVRPGYAYPAVSDDFYTSINDSLLEEDVFLYVFQTRRSDDAFRTQLQTLGSSVASSVDRYIVAPLMMDVISDSVVDASELSSHPFVGSDPVIRINALPFRAYEACANAYFRNEQNNPLIINGEPEYNKYCPNISEGSDTFVYDFHYRNWELDAYTSAVQSPQFGVAPLIGTTVNYGEGTADISLGPITITNPDGTTTSVANSTLKVGVHSDGVINSIINADGVPSGNLQLMMQNITQGISINDIRNANSYQRFLENTIRMGYKYRDQILSHFGVEVPYPDLWMPQFIGGFSVDMNVDQINQTVETDTVALGDYAGQASFVGKSGRPIRFTSHEHGYILCITSITPLPVYTQVLPKMFLRSHPFDFFNTEFSKIGYVPINYKELCPLQSAAAGDDVNDVFGYNRAWYDYVANLDEAHGAFRTTLRDYIMMRTFDSRPELGRDFLVIDPNQVNDVFAVRSAHDVNGYDDKFLGCIYFDYKSQSPVPRFGVPALE